MNNYVGFKNERVTSAVIASIVEWIRSYFKNNGPDCNAVVGISGGKDSSVVAALCVKALGANRVIGVLMPQGDQKDINMAHMLVRYLGIKNITINIKETVDALSAAVDFAVGMSENATINLPARIRMATLFAVSQSVNGRVANTCNLSEDWVGYATLFGDGAGQFSPLANLTVTEVRQIGVALGLPSELVYKIPEDGLCGKTDEESLGFSYDFLDSYIRTGYFGKNTDLAAKIDSMHEKNMFKLKMMPSYSAYELNKVTHSFDDQEKTMTVF